MMDRPIDAKPTTLVAGGENAFAARIHLCAEEWSSLKPTGAPRIRHCTACDRTVMLVVDVDGYNRAAVDQQCVALHATKPGPEPVEKVYLGGRSIEYLNGVSKLTWD